jgi:hypothetical protein
LMKKLNPQIMFTSMIRKSMTKQWTSLVIIQKKMTQSRI